MHFSFVTTARYLFEEWTTGTSTGLALCCVLAGIVALLLEGLKALIAHLDVSTEQSWRSCYNVRRSLIAALQLFLGYILMLLIMTYNAWVAISLVSGSVLGYFLFGWTHVYGNIKTDLQSPGDKKNGRSPTRTNKQALNKSNGYWQVPVKDATEEDRETIL